MVFLSALPRKSVSREGQRHHLYSELDEMMIQQLFIPGPLPGLNEIMAANLKRRGKWNAYDMMKRAWGSTIVTLIQQANLTPVDSCFLTFTWYEPTKKRDPDNVSVGKKFILDSLVMAGILKNDGWKQVQGFEDFWYVSKQQPGVMVEVRG